MSLTRNLLVALSVSLCGLTSLAQAKPVKLAKLEPNCEAHGKKSHVKNKAACDKKQGKWLEADLTKPVDKPVEAKAGETKPVAPANGGTVTPPAEQGGEQPSK